MKKRPEIYIKKISASDRTWIKNFCQDRWGASRVASKGVLHDVPSLPGFIALDSGKQVGLLTYQIKDGELEIVTLDSLEKNIGIGSTLITKAVETAELEGWNRVWLITTKDNTPALRFYQKRGFRLVATYLNALDNSRKLKPEIPQIGLEGIPLRDEIELELKINQ